MNKSELVNAMAEKSGLSKKDAASALNALTEVITEALKAGEEIGLTGFGSFHVSKREAREGRNPTTGEVIKFLQEIALHLRQVKCLKMP